MNPAARTVIVAPPDDFGRAQGGGPVKRVAGCFSQSEAWRLPPPVRALPSLAPWQIRLAKRLLSQSSTNIAGVALECGLSPHYFMTAFANTVGDTPYQWSLRHRILRARRLLRRTDKTIAEVALDCGFADQSHLTNRFKKLVGVAPGRWRRQVRELLQLSMR